MRLREKLWLAVVAACLVGTAWVIRDSRPLWRYVSVVRHGSALASRSDIAAGLTDEVRLADPEAAAIVTWCLEKPNGRELARLLAEYPDNEFFLAQLASELIDANCVDPRAALALADRLIENAATSDHLQTAAGLLYWVEWARLRNLDLSPDQAQQARLQIGRAVAIQMIHQDWWPTEDAANASLARATRFASGPLPLLLQLPLAWLFLLVVNVFRGRAHHVKAGVKAYILFIVGLVGTLALSASPVLLHRWLPGQLWVALGLLGVAIGAWVSLWLLSRMIRCDRVSRNRLTQIILVLVLMTGVTTLVRPLPIVPAMSVFLTILFAGIVATHRHEGYMILADGLRHFFSRDDEMTAARTKVAHMMSAILTVCWLTILVAAHVSAPKWQRLHTVLTNPLSLYRPLPEATRETYGRVMATTRSARDEQTGMSGILEYGAPDEAAALIAERRVAGKPPSDRDLLFFLRMCSRDTRPVILGALQDPNDLEALLKRPEWGDYAVKDRLAQCFKEKLAKLTNVVSGLEVDLPPPLVGPLHSVVRNMGMCAIYMPSMNAWTNGSEPSPEPNQPWSEENPSVLGRLLQMADALACVSDSEEADARYRQLFEFLTGERYEQVAEIVAPPSRSRSEQGQARHRPSARTLLGRLVRPAETRLPVTAGFLEDANAVNGLIARARVGDDAVTNQSIDYATHFHFITVCLRP